MTREEAHQILDRVKNGLWEPDRQIKEALFVLGDLSKSRDTVRRDGFESCFVRSRTLYGKDAYNRIFGSFQEFRPRRESED